MPCRYCKTVENNSTISNDKCSFHITKDVIFKSDYGKIKEWIDNLYLQSNYSYKYTTISSFRNVFAYDLPKLLKQKTIHKKHDKQTLLKLTNYILSLAKKEKIIYNGTYT